MYEILSKTNNLMKIKMADALNTKKKIIMKQ